MAKLESCESLRVSAVEGGALHGVQQSRNDCG